MISKMTVISNQNNRFLFKWPLYMGMGMVKLIIVWSKWKLIAFIKSVNITEMPFLSKMTHNKMTVIHHKYDRYSSISNINGHFGQDISWFKVTLVWSKWTLLKIWAITVILVDGHGGGRSVLTTVILVANFW